MANESYISKVKLPNGDTYDIKDENLNSAFEGFENYDDTEVRSLIGQKVDSSSLSNYVAKTDVKSSLDVESTLPPSVQAVNAALGDKVDKVSGKGLSANDFTTAYKTALDNLESTYVKLNQVESTTLTGADSTEQTILDAKLPTIGIIRAALANMATSNDLPTIIKQASVSSNLNNDDAVPTVKAVNSLVSGVQISTTDHLTAGTGETQADIDAKVPTTGAVRAALPIITSTDQIENTTSLLQSKAIYNNLETSTSGSVSYYEGSTVAVKMPTIAVVKKIIQLFDTKVTQTKLAAGATGNKPLILGASMSTSTDTTYFDESCYYNSTNQELVAPHITQSSGGNYYITTGTTTPSNTASYAEFGLNEIYLQYDE